MLVTLVQYHSDSDWYQCITNATIVKSLGRYFWSGNLFLIAPFPDLCLLVPLSTNGTIFTNVACVRGSPNGTNGL